MTKLYKIISLDIVECEFKCKRLFGARTIYKLIAYMTVGDSRLFKPGDTVTINMGKYNLEDIVKVNAFDVLRFRRDSKI